MKKSLRSLALLGAICGSAAVGGALATSGLGHLSVARASAEVAQVAQARQSLETTNDLSTVFKALSKAVEPSVVMIQTQSTPTPAVARGANPLREFFRLNPNVPNMPNIPDMPDVEEGPQALRVGTGSGVIMQVDGSTGYILTNNHVVADAGKMRVTLSDGRIVEDATVVGTDPRTDLAVIKLKADNLVAAPWGDSTKMEKGDWVVAFGSPLGFVGSMTHGIVSALNRTTGILGQFGQEDFIQVDAPINPGNSGGPLVNLKGEVIGINQSIASNSGTFSGLGFAVPTATAKPIFERLKSDGKIVRGYLGVGIADAGNPQLREDVQSTGYKGTTGAFISQVVSKGPAASKLLAGDVVTAIDGKPVKDSREFRQIIAISRPGSSVKLTLVRNGKEITETVKLGTQPTDDLVRPASVRKLQEAQPERHKGLMLQDVDERSAATFGLDASQTGALVTNVEPNSAAARAGLRPGDVITQINGAPVADAQDAAAALKVADLAKGLRLNVTNREGSRFVMIREK